MTDSIEQHDFPEQSSSLPESTLLEWASVRLARIDGFPKEANYFSCGVFHGLEEFAAATATLGTGEEHRTAAAMGFIASHLSWYQLLAHIAGEQSRLDCCWGVVSKTDESTSGVDFGIAVDIGEGLYNVCCCQAKNAVSGGATHAVQLDIDQMPGTLKRDDADQARTEAHRAVSTWLNGELPECSGESIKQNHQIVKMAHLARDLKTRSGSAPGQPGADPETAVHYVIWREKGGAACTVSLADAKQQLQQIQSSLGRLTFTKSGMAEASSKLTLPSTRAFAQLIDSGQTSGAAGWMAVRHESMEGLVSDWVALGISWLLVDQGSGSLSAMLVKANVKSKTLTLGGSGSTPATYTGPRLPKPLIGITRKLGLK